MLNKLFIHGISTVLRTIAGAIANQNLFLYPTESVSINQGIPLNLHTRNSPLSEFFVDGSSAD